MCELFLSDLIDLVVKVLTLASCFSMYEINEINKGDTIQINAASWFTFANTVKDCSYGPCLLKMYSVFLS